MKRFTSNIILLLLVGFVFVYLFQISLVKASETIYIRADGNVEGTDKIQRDGNVYTFTDNINESIVIERDNIVVDGAGHTLKGTGRGIDMAEKNNITVKNLKITNFYHGIYMPGSNNNTFYRNYIANCANGFFLYSSSFNYIIYNTVTNNSHGGIYIVYSSSYNVVYGNNIINNMVFLWMQGQGNIVDRNYWSSYSGIDENGDGIGDTPYVFYKVDSLSYTDSHPLMKPAILPPTIIPEIPDTKPPTVSIGSPENKTYTVNNVSLTFTVSEPTAWIGYSLNVQTNVTITGNTTLTGLSDGSHSLKVYAKDSAGNIGASETIHFSIAQKSEPFPITWIVAAIVIIVVVGAALLVYFRKIKKTIVMS